MRGRATTIAAIVLLVGAVSTSGAQRPEEEQAVRNVLTGFADIWGRADVKAFGELVTEDAEWVTRSGVYLRGRRDIVAHHTKLLTDTFKGSRVVWTPLAVRFVRPDVVVAHVSTTMTFRDTTTAPRPGMVTLVLLKSESRWLITAVQNTDVSPPQG